MFWPTTLLRYPALRHSLPIHGRSTPYCELHHHSCVYCTNETRWEQRQIQCTTCTSGSFWDELDLVLEQPRDLEVDITSYNSNIAWESWSVAVGLYKQCLRHHCVEKNGLINNKSIAKKSTIPPDKQRDRQTDQTDSQRLRLTILDEEVAKQRMESYIQDCNNLDVSPFCGQTWELG